MRVRPRVTVRVLMGAVALAAVAAWAWAAARDARGAAHERECESHLKQLGLGLHNYHDATGSLPAGTIVNDRLPVARRLSWLAVVCRYLWQGFLILLHELEANDAPANLALQSCTVSVGEPPPPYRPLGEFEHMQCPAHDHAATPGRPSETDYIGIAGVGPDAPTLPSGHPRAGVFGDERATRFAEIRDGLAHTMVVAETADRNGPWTFGGPSTVRGVDPARRPYVGKGRPFGGMHRGGALVLMADGSVRKVGPTQAPSVFEAMATVAAGD